MPEVTVVMITRNRRDQTLVSLRQLRALPEQPALVVVDNASTDGTAEAVSTAYPDVMVIRLPANEGAVARTHGVRAARTEVVAFADDDSWWAPGALACAGRLMREHPRLGLVAARVLVGPKERPDPVCAEMAASPLGAHPTVPGAVVLGFLACGAVVRRSAYLAVGGFSPVLFFLGEEEVLAQDLAAAGWDVVYVPDVVAHHHPGSATRDAGRTCLQRRNALLATWLRRPAAVVLARTARALLASRHRDERCALRAALSRLPAALRARRRLPAQVERQVRLLERSA